MSSTRRMNCVFSIAFVFVVGVTTMQQETAATDALDVKAVDGSSDRISPVPKIIAMTWQERDRANSSFSEIPLWTPDGELLSEIETKALKAEIRSTELCWMNQRQSRPLVFILDAGARLPVGEFGVKVQCELPDGKVTGGGTLYPRAAGKKTPNRIFALSAATHFLRDGDAEFQGPESATVVLTYPIDSPMLLDTLHEVPASPIDVAEGVRFEVDPVAGYDPDNPDSDDRFPAGVFETIDDGSLEHANYFVRIFEKGKKRPLPVLFATVHEHDGVEFDARVHGPFPEADQLDRIEFYRQRFTRAQIPNVRIRTDLMPQPTE